MTFSHGKFLDNFQNELFQNGQYMDANHCAKHIAIQIFVSFYHLMKNYCPMIWGTKYKVVRVHATQGVGPLAPIDSSLTMVLRTIITLILLKVLRDKFQLLTNFIMSLI